MPTLDDYRWLFRRAPVMATSIGNDGRYLDVNDALLNRLGYARDDMLGRRPEEFVTPDSAARISEELSKRARDLAKKSHKALFCKGYSRTDMIIKDDDIFVLETNTIPGMTPESLLPLAAEKAGMNFSQLLDRLIELGLEKR